MDSFDHIDLRGAFLAGWDVTPGDVTLHLRSVLVYEEVLPGQYHLTRHRAYLRLSGASPPIGDLQAGEIAHAFINAPDGAALPFTALVASAPAIRVFRLLGASGERLEAEAASATLILEDRDEVTEEIVSALD